MKSTLFFLILLSLSTLTKGSVCADETSPVIFSFGWPTSAEHSTGDYYHIDLDAASIIEIGPRKSSYPPTKVDNFDPEVVDAFLRVNEKHKDEWPLYRRIIDAVAVSDSTPIFRNLLNLIVLYSIFS